MNRYSSKMIFVSLISAILAFTIITEAGYITPSLAQTTGSYIEVSRIINIPKNTPNSTSLPDNGNLTSNNGNLTSNNGNLAGAPIFFINRK